MKPQLFSRVVIQHDCDYVSDVHKPSHFASLTLISKDWCQLVVVAASHQVERLN
jgi:hypothetical protein